MFLMLPLDFFFFYWCENEGWNHSTNGACQPFQFVVCQNKAILTLDVNVDVGGLIIPCSSPYKVKYLAQKKPKLKRSERKRNIILSTKPFKGLRLPVQELQ